MLKSLLVDPSLFTGPYDAALSQGLEANGVAPLWLTRALRKDEEADIPPDRTRPIFYPLSDGPRRRTGAAWRMLKGVEHVAGLNQTVRTAREGYDVVHFQWALLPRLDARAIRRIRAVAPVILTVHDLTPFNGKAVSAAQRSGLGEVLHGVDALIVHTESGRESLVSDGLPAERVHHVPHGPLALKVKSTGKSDRSGRWRIVMFGRIQAYKGVDTLVEAAGRLGSDVRNQIEIVIAGEPMIDMDPIRNRADALGLNATIDFRLYRHNDADMAALLQSADAFAFPYRAIEASGVLFLVADLNKWLLASDVGAFRDMVQDGQNGSIFPPDDPAALANAISASIGRIPAASERRVPDWSTIGAMTRRVYETAIHNHRAAA